MKEKIKSICDYLDYFQEKTRKGKAGKYTFRTENVLIAHRVIKEKEEE